MPGRDPTFARRPCSQYRFGLTRPTGRRRQPDRRTPISLNQLQVNAPNLPLFAQGTVPFLGDYIDIAGQTFVANGNGRLDVQHVARRTRRSSTRSWTDNRDVRPPMDGDWAHYTPAGAGATRACSIPTKTTPPCVAGQEGMRNQNVYSSRITEGLLVGSPQNVKPLIATLEARVRRDAAEPDGQDRTFRLTVTAAGGGVSASFLQTSSLRRRST